MTSDIDDLIVKARRKKRKCMFKVIAVACLIMSVPVGGALFLAHTVRGHQRAGYEAWIQETGNPAQLTYDQWVALYINSGYRGERR